MKRIKALFIEEFLITATLCLLFVLYPERVESIKTGMFMVIAVLVAIIIAKIIEMFIDIRLKRLESDQGNKWLWRLQYLQGFGLVCIDFFVAFRVLEYFGGIPVTTRLLFILSINIAAAHMLISSILDSVVGS